MENLFENQFLVRSICIHNYIKFKKKEQSDSKRKKKKTLDKILHVKK